MYLLHLSYVPSTILNNRDSQMYRYTHAYTYLRLHTHTHTYEHTCIDIHMQIYIHLKHNFPISFHIGLTSFIIKLLLWHRLHASLCDFTSIPRMLWKACKVISFVLRLTLLITLAFPDFNLFLLLGLCNGNPIMSNPKIIVHKRTGFQQEPF